MSAYSLDDLRAAFPALDAYYRGDLAQLRHPDPFAEQVRAAMNPRVRSMEKGGVRSDRRFPPRSPAARLHPEISAGIDRVQQIPLAFDLDGLSGVNRVYSNTGRGPLPMRLVDERYKCGACREYTVDELRAHERETISEAEQRQLDAEYDRELDLADYGGQPTEAVVVHGEEWTDETGVLACPVPMRWSQYRLARYLSPQCRVCFWCNDRARARLDDYLLVSCGAILRAFPTCSGCRMRFAHDTEFMGLDWKILSDRWEAEHGYPSDEWY